MLPLRLAKTALRSGLSSLRYRRALTSARVCSTAGAQSGDGGEFVDGDDPPRMLDLVLVRHGESEGNVAYRLSRGGDHSLYQGACSDSCDCVC
jgi:hypothetical protein